MKRTTAVVLLLLLGACSRVRELRTDQHGIRQAVLGLYTEQLMDNLIRVACHQPFVHVDYKDFSGTVETTAKGKASVGTTEKDLNPRLFPAGVPPPMNQEALSNEMTHTLGAETEATQKTVLNMTGDPVTDSPSVYDAYMDFVSRGFLRASKCPPRQTECHIVRRRGSTYYWIHANDSKEYLLLFLRTTVKRSDTTADPYFRSKAFAVVSHKVSGGAGPVVLQLQGRVPNARGTIEFESNGILIQALVRKNEKLDAGAMTSRVEIFYRQEDSYPTIDALIKNIKGTDVQLQLEGYAPKGGSRELVNRLDSVTRELRRIRVEGIR